MKNEFALSYKIDSNSLLCKYFKTKFLVIKDYYLIY